MKSALGCILLGSAFGVAFAHGHASAMEGCAGSDGEYAALERGYRLVLADPLQTLTRINKIGYALAKGKDLTIVRPKTPVGVFVCFAKWPFDSPEYCTITVDLYVYGPDGCVVRKAEGQTLWCGPQPPGSYPKVSLACLFVAPERGGAYRACAVIHDPWCGRTDTLTTGFFVRDWDRFDWTQHN
jgi:hypothetical protein